MASRKKKASAHRGDLVGGWAFLIGLVLAVILGAMGRVDGAVSTILIVLGLIVGFLNVSEKDVVPLLLGLVALTLVGNATLGVIPAVNAYLVAVLQNIVLFAGAAAFVVSIKAVLTTTKA